MHDPLEAWNRGEKPAAAKMNAERKAIEASYLMGGDGLNVTRTHAGTTIALNSTAVPRASVFPVQLVSDGGDGGDAADPVATWTYSVYYLDDDPADADPIIETAAPIIRLPGIQSEGGRGIGYFDSDGNFTLWQSDELPTGVQCP